MQSATERDALTRVPPPLGSFLHTQIVAEWLACSSTSVYDERGFMQIEPATCPACGSAYDPLRAQAVTVIDGRVRAFCSAACRERGIAPPAPQRSTTDAHAVIALPPSSFWSSVRREQWVLIAAAAVTLLVFVALLVTGRRTRGSVPSDSAAPERAVAIGNHNAPTVEATESDSWLQPLAAVTRRVGAHDRRLFYGREGIPASECSGGRCGVDIEGPAGAVVMAVHDGVVEAVERDPDAAARQGQEGRFIRIVHKGGAFVTSYMQLDGIREDLRPGVPVKMGEPIGTVARATRSHFRFAISARNDDGAMLFIDPQPLLALWPIRRQAAMSLRAMERPSHEPQSTSGREPRENTPAGLGRTDSTE